MRADLEVFRSRFKNIIEDLDGDPGPAVKSYFIRAAKASPSRQQKRPRNIKLSFENTHVPVLDLSVFNEENCEQPQALQAQDETVKTIHQAEDELSVEVLFI